MRLDDQLDRALEDALRARHALPDVLRTMRDSMPGQPGARGYDAVVIAGGRTVLWCWDHEREVRLCHRAGEPCTGESVTVADQTGEAAVEGLDDDVCADHKATQKDIANLADAAGRLVRRFAVYQKRAATEKERREAERTKESGCELHARVGAWRIPRVLSSDVRGNLDRPHRLCEWCERVVLDLGRKPTDDELRDNVAGKKLRRTA